MLRDSLRAGLHLVVDTLRDALDPSHPVTARISAARTWLDAFQKFDIAEQLEERIRDLEARAIRGSAWTSLASRSSAGCARVSRSTPRSARYAQKATTSPRHVASRSRPAKLGAFIV